MERSDSTISLIKLYLTLFALSTHVLQLKFIGYRQRGQPMEHGNSPKIRFGNIGIMSNQEQQPMLKREFTNDSSPTTNLSSALLKQSFSPIKGVGLFFASNDQAVVVFKSTGGLNLRSPRTKVAIHNLGLKPSDLVSRQVTRQTLQG